MVQDYAVALESEIVNATKEEVWSHITQMKNVNEELSPYVRMTFPKDRADIASHDIRSIPMNTVLFTSVLLLFGWIPFDLHFLAFDRIVNGTAFYENSSTLLNRYWKHTRIISERGGKVFVSDEVHFSPRVPFIGSILTPVVRHIFVNRHKQLKRAFSN
jgi:ligand-binding SRPBCC domain-containing protein